MRARRLERLAELQRQGEHLPLVADGAAEAAAGAAPGAPAGLGEPRACYACKRRFYHCTTPTRTSARPAPR